MSEPGTSRPRKFLVVVDRTPECRVALRFAARRAQHTGGRVSLLCIVAPADYHEWRGVEEIMQDEARLEAENLVWDAAGSINELTGILPEIIIENGAAEKALLDLVRRDGDISILVLASSPSKDGPGPLVSLFATGIRPIPATIVPGNLSDEDVDALA
jgi:nucleotide-binding universal stress UspA family protein